MNEEPIIREFRIDDTPPKETVEINGWCPDNFYIKCICTTLIVTRKHFQDIFKTLEKGDTFKAVVDRHDDLRLSNFKYFLRIDKEYL